METNGNEKPNWFTVFRTNTEEKIVKWLYDELTKGRLRQGWGVPGLALKTDDGRRVEKTQWEAAYKRIYKEDPSPKRFAILTRMLDMEDGDVVVVPKMPKWDQFTIARVSGGYWFETDGDREDFRDEFHHIVPVLPRQHPQIQLPREQRCESRLRPLHTSQSLVSGFFLLQGRADQGGPPATANPKRPDLESPGGVVRSSNQRRLQGGRHGAWRPGQGLERGSVRESRSEGL